MKRFALSMIIVLASTSLAFAAAKTGDITVDSQAGNVTNVASGQNAQATTNVHSVDVKDGPRRQHHVKARPQLTQRPAANVKSETNVGSVKVGGK